MVYIGGIGMAGMLSQQGEGRGAEVCVCVCVCVCMRMPRLRGRDKHRPRLLCGARAPAECSTTLPGRRGGLHPAGSAVWWVLEAWGGARAMLAPHPSLM